MKRDLKPVIYISTVLNEILAKVGKGKPKEEVIKSVTVTLVETVNRAANNQGTISNLYLIGYPYIRQDPKWMEERSSSI